MEITVTLTDGRTILARPNMRDFIAFERKFDRPVSDFSESGRIEWLLFLVHNHLARTDEDVPAKLDDFAELVEDIDAEGDEDERPTQDEVA